MRWLAEGELTHFVSLWGRVELVQCSVQWVVWWWNVLPAGVLSVDWLLRVTMGGGWTWDVSQSLGPRKQGYSGKIPVTHLFLQLIQVVPMSLGPTDAMGSVWIGRR